ncbi:MAG: type III-B CRISPR module RAMP protein Cmr6 [Nitrospirota bacterium]
MPIAAVPSYLGNDFTEASPALRFGLLLPIWTTRSDQEKEVRKRAQARSPEGRTIADLLNRQGMDGTIHALRERQRNPLPGLWAKNDFAAREAWAKVKSFTKADNDRMNALSKRQDMLSHTIPNLFRLSGEAISPFTTGLGNEHPLENGFAFLNPYGLPYLPGSGVKGVLRQAARELASGQWGDTQGWSEHKGYRINVGTHREPHWLELSMLDVLFGRETPSGDADHVRGALSFWDVIPQIQGDSLLVEIMTPHQTHYYQQSAQAGSRTPHDSGQPNPISFLTVPPGSTFTFHVVCDVAHLRRVTKEKAPTAPDLLAEGESHWTTLLRAAFRHAFHWLGFGAKTAVGYGAMKEPAAPSNADKPGRVAVPTPRSRWVDDKLRELCSKPGIKPDDALRGSALAEAVRAIEDPALRAQALDDIVARWKEKGWWDTPTGGAAKKAKAIYEELVGRGPTAERGPVIDL